ERFKQEDSKRREEVEARNSADSLIYQAEKLLREQGEQAPAEIKSEVEDKIAACRSALEADDMTRIQTTVQELSEVLQRLGASMYEQPETPPPGDAEGGPPPDDEDVVEGEFSEA
ncbi:MAG: Hsp70 family protein, partial [Anaerolineae bacterium]